MRDIRYRIKMQPYTKLERLWLWWRNIKCAIREVPETHYSEYIEVKKGDPDYNEAPYAFTWVTSSPLRWEIKDGQYFAVDQTTPISQSNPNWRDA
jgi:hypothetical protein